MGDGGRIICLQNDGRSSPIGYNRNGRGGCWMAKCKLAICKEEGVLQSAVSKMVHFSPYSFAALYISSYLCKR